MGVQWPVVVAVVVTLGMSAVADAQDVPAIVLAAGTTPQRGVATALDAVCPRFAGATGPTADLRDRCTELLVQASRPDLLSQVRVGLQQIVPDNAPVLGALSLGVGTLQFRSILARLSTLREGASDVGSTTSRLDGGESHEPVVAALAADPAAMSPLGKLGVFLTGGYSFAHYDSTNRAAGFDPNAGTVLGGVDYRFTRDLVLGAAFGYTVTKADLGSSRGDIDADSYGGSVYGSYFFSDRFYVDAIASGGANHFNTVRRIQYSIPALDAGITVVDQNAKADPDGTWYSLGASGGYDVNIGAVTFGPLGRINYTSAHVDGYREGIRAPAPGVGLALRVEDQRVESLVSSLGVQGSYAISTPLGVSVPQLRLEWQHEFLYDPRTIAATFVNDPRPTSATTIRYQTDAPDRDFFTLGVGLAHTFRAGIAGFIYYERVLGLQNATVQRLMAGVRMGF